MIAKFIEDERGVAAVEYVVLLAALAAGVVIAVASLGERLQFIFDQIFWSPSE